MFVSEAGATVRMRCTCGLWRSPDYPDGSSMLVMAETATAHMVTHPEPPRACLHCRCAVAREPGDTGRWGIAGGEPGSIFALHCTGRADGGGHEPDPEAIAPHPVIRLAAYLHAPEVPGE